MIFKNLHQMNLYHLYLHCVQASRYVYKYGLARWPLLSLSLLLLMNCYIYFLDFHFLMYSILHQMRFSRLLDDEPQYIIWWHQNIFSLYLFMWLALSFPSSSSWISRSTASNKQARKVFSRPIETGFSLLSFSHLFLLFVLIISFLELNTA